MTYWRWQGHISTPSIIAHIIPKEPALIAGTAIAVNRHRECCNARREISLDENIPPNDATTKAVKPWLKNSDIALMAPEFRSHGLDVLSVTGILVAGQKR